MCFIIILVWNMNGANVLLMILFVKEKFFFKCFELLTTVGVGNIWLLSSLNVSNFS